MTSKRKSKAQRSGYKALSFQEPWATLIATGVKKNEYRSRRINTPVKDLVVCASKTARHYDPIPGVVYGKAIGLVDIVSCVSDGHSGWVWKLCNPRLIEPFDVHATASFFYVENEPSVIDSNEASYRAYVLPLSQNGSDEMIEITIDAMFGKEAAMRSLLRRSDLEWL